MIRKTHFTSLFQRYLFILKVSVIYIALDLAVAFKNYYFFKIRTILPFKLYHFCLILGAKTQTPHDRVII